jgi:hypothetical protein
MRTMTLTSRFELSYYHSTITLSLKQLGQVTSERIFLWLSHFKFLRVGILPDLSVHSAAQSPSYHTYAGM